jgi:hypothetical protein
MKSQKNQVTNLFILNLLVISSFLLCGFKTSSVNAQAIQESHHGDIPEFSGIEEQDLNLLPVRTNNPKIGVQPHTQPYVSNPAFINYILQETDLENQPEIENRDEPTLDPRVFVLRFDHFIDGYEWTPNTQITLTIDEEDPWTAQSDGDGYVPFHLGSFEITPGQNVTMTDGVYTRYHIVRNITVTAANSETNIIYGTADPNSDLISVYVDNGNESKWLYPTADSEGIWAADFTGYVSFEPGTQYWVYQRGGENTWTDIYGTIPNPHITANAEGDYISGSEWPSNTEIILTINGTNTWNGTTNETGEIYFSFSSFDVLAGQTVVMTDGSVIRTHIITNLAITEIDKGSDIIRGIAEPYSKVDIHAVGDDNWSDEEYLELYADESGNWQANFVNVDVREGSFGWIYNFTDDEGNLTQVDYEVPNPFIEVYLRLGLIVGWNWPPNSEVEMSIAGNHWTGQTDSDGMVEFTI